jgi:hypothetical protein
MFGFRTKSVIVLAKGIELTKLPIIFEPCGPSAADRLTHMMLQAAELWIRLEGMGPTGKPRIRVVDDFWSGYRATDEDALRRSLHAERWKLNG